jgi:nitrite reductase/ring-hydroxylating ferredoxin subunit
MSFKEVARYEDVLDGTMKHIEIGQKEILIANVAGKIYAIDDRCGHMNAPLSMGKLKGNIVECVLHHAQYDVTTGKNVRNPQMDGLEGIILSATRLNKITANIKAYDRQSYKVKVESGAIKLDIQTS